MLVTMYGLKKEIDLSFLTGRELIQVAIGSFQVQFHFDEDVALSAEGDFAISTDTRNSSREYVRREEKAARASGAYPGCFQEYYVKTFSLEQDCHNPHCATSSM